jgi:hypothetical protein
MQQVNVFVSYRLRLIKYYCKSSLAPKEHTNQPGLSGPGDNQNNFEPCKGGIIQTKTAANATIAGEKLHSSCI